MHYLTQMDTPAGPPYLFKPRHPDMPSLPWDQVFPVIKAVVASGRRMEVTWYETWLSHQAPRKHRSPGKGAGGKANLMTNKYLQHKQC